MKRKTIIVIIVVVVVILLAISAWLIYKKYFKKTGINDGGGEVYDPGVYPSGGGGYASASFPVKRGMSGSVVIDIQNAINKKCNKGLVPDGAFGPLTETALKSCYGTNTVSQALYTQMKFDSGSTVTTGTGCPEGQYKVAGLCVKIGSSTTTSPTTSTALKAGDKVYSKIAGMLLFNTPSGNDSIGKMSSNEALTKSIGTFVAYSTEGFSKIRLSGEVSYLINEGTTRGLAGWRSVPTEVYVYTSLIRK